MPILLSDCIVAGKGESGRAEGACFGASVLHAGAAAPFVVQSPPPGVGGGRSRTCSPERFARALLARFPSPSSDPCLLDLKKV